MVRPLGTGRRRAMRTIATKIAYAVTSGGRTCRSTASAPEEEGPSSDEQVPSEPQPQPEQDEAPGGHRHERAEEVRERWPSGSSDEPDALPDEQGRDDPEPPDERGRAHVLTSRLGSACPLSLWRRRRSSVVEGIPFTRVGSGR